MTDNAVTKWAARGEARYTDCGELLGYRLFSLMILPIRKVDVLSQIKTVLLSLVGILTICGAAPLSASEVSDAAAYQYNDNFDTDKAQTDSVSHSIFWPEAAFPPTESYLYYSSAKGNPPRSLVFMGYEGKPAHLSYCFPLPVSMADSHRGLIGTVAFEVQSLRERTSGSALNLSFSTDGYNWTVPSLLPTGHHAIAVACPRGTCHIAFFGTMALLDNLQVHLTSAEADINVPGDFATIQDAIDAASSGQIVEVAPGVYSGDGNRDIDFRGKAFTLRSADGPESTIIDCNNADGLDGVHRGFYFHQAENADSVLQGFTILSGCAPGSEIPADALPWSLDPAHPIGGGIYCELSSPTIINCVIRNCGAEIGGGIGCVGGAPVITDCVVDNCRAGGFGPAESGGCGGGIGVIRGCSASIVGCTVRNNAGYDNSYGGGIFVKASNPWIVNCSIYSNTSPGNLAGGGMYCGPASNVALRNCLIFQNVGQAGGGIMAESRNTAPLCNLLVDNCTIAHNALGGPVAPLAAGGLQCDDCDLQVKNGIFWYNDACQISLTELQSTGSVTYCNVQGGYPGQGNIDDEPQFASIGAPARDYHLKSLYGRYDPQTGQWVRDFSHSPSIDRGDPADRMGQEPAPNGNRINMGAYGGTREASKSNPGGVYHVDASTGDDRNTGLTRTSAFKTVQQAINVASDSDVVLLWPGVYGEQVNFGGKAITVQSAADAAVLEAPSGYAFSFYTAETHRSVLRNIVIQNSLYGIYCDGGSPTITNLTIVDNEFGIAAYGGAEPDITNCIFWGNRSGDVFQCEARYSRLDDPDPNEASGNTNDNPLFADPEQGDYHLLSERGRYVRKDPNNGGDPGGYWILDAVSSPCIDKADPTVSPMGERFPNGGRLNMGAYGGTGYASMSEWPLAGDTNHDGVMNFIDLAVIAETWLQVLPWVNEPVLTPP